MTGSIPTREERDEWRARAKSWIESGTFPPPNWSAQKMIRLLDALDAVEAALANANAQFDAKVEDRLGVSDETYER